MATRTVKSLGRSGDVTRRQIRAAVDDVRLNFRGKLVGPGSKIVIKRSDTATGKGLISFRVPSHPRRKSA